MVTNSTLTTKELAQYIDHTLLRPEATAAEIEKLCAEAREHSFKAVCVERQFIPLAVKQLAGSPVLVATVLSFPHGTDSEDEKIRQAEESVAAGAKELDMVLNRGHLKERRYGALYSEIRNVVERSGVLVKIILETSELTANEKVVACAVAQAAGAHFVKTSTGFSASGATEEDVRLMRQVVGLNTGVKASGGVRTLEKALQMIHAGANRIGTSSSVAILTDLGKQK